MRDTVSSSDHPRPASVPSLVNRFAVINQASFCPRGNKGVMRSIPSRSMNFLLMSDRVTQLLSNDTLRT
jgi:hypothetical protein